MRRETGGSMTHPIVVRLTDTARAIRGLETELDGLIARNEAVRAELVQRALGTEAQRAEAQLDERSNAVEDCLDELRAARSAVDDDEEIKREKLREIQSRSRKADEEEAARSGRYYLIADVQSAMTGLARNLMSVFGGAIVELASKVAARHGVDAREEEFAMRADFHV